MKISQFDDSRLSSCLLNILMYSKVQMDANSFCRDIPVLYHLLVVSRNRELETTFYLTCPQYQKNFNLT